jgi:uncharacterized tellurite resistance protein B-like protein
VIIFGTRGIRMKKGEGTFFCPRCQGSRQYTLRRIRRFFTLYFIPVIPLDAIGDFVECNYCKGQYEREVLEYQPQATVTVHSSSNAERQRVLRRAILSVLVADGTPSEMSVSVAADAIERIASDPGFSRADLDEAVTAAVRRPGNAANDVVEIAGTLDYAAKEAFVLALLRVALADHAISAAEERQIRALAAAAGLTSAHVSGILATHAGTPRLGA